VNLDPVETGAQGVGGRHTVVVDRGPDFFKRHGAGWRRVDLHVGAVCEKRPDHKLIEIVIDAGWRQRLLAAEQP
jgi:hypothetical protein